MFLIVDVEHLQRYAGATDLSSDLLDYFRAGSFVPSYTSDYRSSSSQFGV